MFSISAMAAAASLGMFAHQHGHFRQPSQGARPEAPAPAMISYLSRVLSVPQTAHQNRLHDAPF